MQTKIISIALGKEKTYQKSDEKFQSAYKKDQFFQFVDVDYLGIDGDIKVDKRFHGGEDKAIHIGSNLHFQRFQELHSKPLDKMAFGCNIFIDSFDEKDIHAGDIFSIADIKLQVTQPRQPCWKIGALFGKDASRYIIKNYATGWYLKVLEGGTLDIKDPLVLDQRMSDLTIYDMSRYLHIPPTDKKLIDRILSFDFVAKSYKDDLLKVV